MVLAHGAQTPGSAKSPTRDSLEAQPVEFESLMQESGSADFLARHALYSQPPLCVCVCVHCRPPSYVLGSRIPPLPWCPIWAPPSTRGRCREMERGWSERWPGRPRPGTPVKLGLAA